MQTAVTRSSPSFNTRRAVRLLEQIKSTLSESPHAHMQTSRLNRLAGDIRDFVFRRLDQEPDISADEVGQMAQEVEQAVRRVVGNR